MPQTDTNDSARYSKVEFLQERHLRQVTSAERVHRHDTNTTRLCPVAYPRLDRIALLLQRWRHLAKDRRLRVTWISLRRQSKLVKKPLRRKGSSHHPRLTKSPSYD
jgi:hypothetical protein